MGGWYRSQTKKSVLTQPSHCPRKQQHRGHGLSCLMAAQPEIWLLQQGHCGTALRPGAGPSWGAGT